MTARSLDIIPVSGCTCGAVVRNLALATLTDADFDQVHQQLL